MPFGAGCAALGTCRPEELQDFFREIDILCHDVTILTYTLGFVNYRQAIGAGFTRAFKRSSPAQTTGLW
jgi:hypothetical protein